MVEHLKSKSTQPNFETTRITLYVRVRSMHRILASRAESSVLRRFDNHGAELNVSSHTSTSNDNSFQEGETLLSFNIKSTQLALNTESKLWLCQSSKEIRPHRKSYGCPHSRLTQVDQRELEK